jgi:Arc/MetJ-type ribon-helix-helix transcriptional regulator
MIDRLINDGNYMNSSEYIKGDNSLTKEELITLREKYIHEYSKKKGWNSDNLSSEQLLEIVQSNGYKNPGILLS